MEQREYVRRLLEAYRATPGTAGVVRRPDRLFAAQLHEPRRAAGNGRERVDTCGGAAFGEASRCAAARDDSVAGILLAGDRGSPATEGRPGILSASPQQTPARHSRTITPVSFQNANPRRAPSARMISSPSHLRKTTAHACGVDDDVCSDQNPVPTPGHSNRAQVGHFS